MQIPDRPFPLGFCPLSFLFRFLPLLFLLTPLSGPFTVQCETSLVSTVLLLSQAAARISFGSFGTKPIDLRSMRVNGATDLCEEFRRRKKAR